MTGLHLQLLGGFNIAFDGSPVPGFHQPRLQALLAYLVLNREKPQTRASIAFLFWPDSTEKQARTNLRKLVYSLRKALPESNDYLALTTETIGWQNDAPYHLDVAEFEGCLAGAAVKKSALKAAVAAYRGELLPGFYDEWILAERERLRSLYGEALLKLSTLHEEERDYPAAVGAARRLLEMDALQESTYRLLMRLYLLNNDRGAALAVFHRCSTVLREELGVDPSPLTAELYQRVLQLETAVPDAPQVAETLSLIGRNHEWKQLEQLWRQVQKGGPATLYLIQGEAGIGKTRLAEELVNSTRRLGMKALHTRAYGAEGAGPYAPIVDLLRAVDRAAMLESLEPVWLTEVARLLPDLLDGRSDILPPQPITEGWQRQRFQEGLVRGVLAGGQPLLIHFDDLHWCDPETLTWLRFLLGYDRQGRLLVVGTVRNDEIEFNDPLKTLRFDLEHKGRCQVVNLNPLRSEDVAKLAAEVVGQALSSEQIGRLFTESEGNPLFLIEMLRAGSAEGAATEEIGEWLDETVPATNGGRLLPSKVQAVIRWRLSQLTPEAHELAEAASVIGRRFQHDLLAFVGDMPEKDLVRGLDELWRRRIIREETASDYDFSHDRLREVAYAQISPMQRRYLHKRAAQALERLNADELDPFAGRIARHYKQAGADEAALPFFERAGRYSAAQFAHEEAIRYFSRALAILPDEQKDGRYDLLMAQEGSYHFLGNREAQAADLENLADLAAELGLAQQVQVALRQARYALFTTDYLVTIEKAQAALAQAREVGDEAAEAEANYLWGSGLHEQGKFEEAKTKLALGAELAQRANAARTASDCLRMLGEIARHQAILEESREYHEQSLTIARQMGDKAREGWALSELAATHWYIGNYELDRIYLEAALKIFRQIGNRAGEAKILSDMAVTDIHRGQYKSSEIKYKQSLAIAREIGDKRGESDRLNGFGLLYWYLGNYQKAQTYLEQDFIIGQELDIKERMSHNYYVWGYVALSMGEKGRAKKLNLLALAITREIGYHLVEGFALHGLGDVYLAEGDLDLAESHYKQALTLWQEHDIPQDIIEEWTGLADVALAKKELKKAQAYVDAILAQMEDNPGGFAYYMRTYLACIRVLQALRDEKASAILEEAYNALQKRAEPLDQEERRMYLENVPEHREIITMWESLRK